MENDLKALNDLVEEYTNKETELMKTEQELATRDQQFANFITAQRRLKEAKEVISGLIKEELEKQNLKEYETESVILKLTPSGKYKIVGREIEDVDDSVCEIKKTLSNKKVKSYLELNGRLPDGVVSTGNILRIKVKENEDGAN